ncbi:MFS transporter [Frankia sp. AgB1.9]|nr:MFS transporter [Frankia sp. AgW1.1]MBL7546391.1 MFS transporter [Frankia sp. AgB1.9]MBL7618564.1 MFS transporter [Frankia sp. AgB1.8]
MIKIGSRVVPGRGGVDTTICARRVTRVGRIRLVHGAGGTDRGEPMRRERPMTATGDTGYNLARGTWRIPRSRGAMAGLLLMALGAWGALIPFIGPAFHFGFGGSQTWSWTAARFWLEVLPGIACFVGGVMLTFSANRGATMLGAWLAMAAGAWFIIGPTVAGPLHLGDLGYPMGGTTRITWTWLLFFYGLGAVILSVASMAHGRLSVRSLRDVEHATMRARSKQLARQGGGLFGGGGGGGRGRGDREREPARQNSGRDDRLDRAERDSRDRDSRDHAPYPTDTAHADRAGGPTALPVDSRSRGDVHGSEQGLRDENAGRRGETTTTVYPSETESVRSSSTETQRGRHEAGHEGFSEKIGHFENAIGRTLAKHGIGGSKQDRR